MAYHSIASNNNTTSNNNNNMGQQLPPQPTTNDVPESLIDYEKEAKQGKIHNVLFREQTTNKLLTALNTHNHPNSLLIGEAGVGKTAIVESLAVKLLKQDPVTIAMLGKDTKIYELPLNNLVAGASMFGELEKRVKEVVTFAKNPENHAILYIDEIHQLMTNQSLKNVSEILKPELSRGDLHVIGSTTSQELKFWKENPAMDRRFSQINVPELSNEQTVTILKKVLPNLQDSQQTAQINDDLFNFIVQTGNNFSKSLTTHRPDSAITILDQALAISRLQVIQLKNNTGMSMNPQVNKKVIKKAGDELTNKENVNLSEKAITKLKDQLEKNIIGQNNAKKSIIKAAQGISLNLINPKRPHSFLFMGPTGTGKTAIAEQTNKTLFGINNKMIKLNMTEFSNEAMITQIIGSARGYVGSDSAQPLPLDGLKTNPFQIVLLDEFEKAAPKVQKLFMKALDEGDLQYADGSHVDFSHAIIIATTNAGSKELNKNTIGFGNKQKVSKQEVTKTLNKQFPPELVNRFENVINFTKINKEDYAKVLCIKYNQTRNEIAENHPELKIMPQIAKSSMNFIQKLAQESYDPAKNARPAERTIYKFIENEIIKQPGQNKFNFDV